MINTWIPQSDSNTIRPGLLDSPIRESVLSDAEKITMLLTVCRELIAILDSDLTVEARAACPELINAKAVVGYPVVVELELTAAE